VSIARRLQDPLAELVKIDPQSIGVGQYQHDLSEHKLSRSLHAVVEDCVNAVGVDVNTASTPLLSRVSGIGDGLARSIVSYREGHGPFPTRSALKKVSRLGPKAFELSAGFLRISNGDDPLDASGVHPEAYPVVRRILAATKSQLGALIGRYSWSNQSRLDCGRTCARADLLHEAASGLTCGGSLPQILEGRILRSGSTSSNLGRISLCCTDQQPGAVSPRSNILREANVLRPAKLEHAVQRGDSNGHLSRLPAPGP